MRSFITLSTSLMLLLSCVAFGDSEIDTPENLGESIVVSLQKNDLDNFLSLCGTSDDIITLLEESKAENIEDEIQELKKREGSGSDFNKRVIEDLREKFFNLGGERKWADLEILKVEKTEIEEEGLRLGMSTVEGVVLLKCDVRVYFKGYGSSFLKIEDVVKYKNGWKMEYNQGSIKWKR